MVRNLILSMVLCAIPSAMLSSHCSGNDWPPGGRRPSNTVDDDRVQFDVPALLEAKQFECTDSIHNANHRVIAVTIPVSSEISRSEQGNIHAFRFDVFWNRNGFPIVDYAPKTQTFSEIVGTIAVDKSTEKGSSHDVKLNGSYPPFANGSLLVDGNQRESLTLHYSEVPQHEILVAAGTVRRGTGAFFRFHPSRAETLEGGRDLLLTFKVPRTWRGGILQVECTASGSRRYLGWKEAIEVQRAFVVPVFLENDEEAEQSAMEMVQQEQKLRQSWQRFQSLSSTIKTPSISVDSFMSLGNRNSSRQVVPDDWVHALIQTNDQPLERYRNRLPNELATSASLFVESREKHLKLSR